MQMQEQIFGVQHLALGQSQGVKVVETAEEAEYRAELMNEEMTPELAECNSFHAVQWDEEEQEWVEITDT